MTNVFRKSGTIKETFNVEYTYRNHKTPFENGILASMMLRSTRMQPDKLHIKFDNEIEVKLSLNKNGEIHGPVEIKKEGTIIETRRYYQGRLIEKNDDHFSQLTVTFEEYISGKIRLLSRFESKKKREESREEKKRKMEIEIEERKNKKKTKPIPKPRIKVEITEEEKLIRKRKHADKQKEYRRRKKEEKLKN